MKKHLNAVIILLTFVSMISCEDNKKMKLNADAILFDKFPKESKVSLKNLFEYKHGIPRGIFPIDSVLIIHNAGNNAKFFFCNYELKKGKLSKGYAIKGRGPNEFIFIDRAGIAGNKLWMYDINLKKIILTNVDKAIRNCDLSGVKEFHVKDYFVRLNMTDSLYFYGVEKVLNPTGSKIDKIDLFTGKKVDEYGHYAKASSDLKLETIRGVYSSHICSKPSGEKIVLAYIYSDLIEIYNLKTKECIAIQGPEKFDVNFEQQKSGAMYYKGTTMQTRTAAIATAVTDKYIYLVYSGYKRKDRSEEDKYKCQNGKYIHVFDWNGNPVKRIILDRLIGGCLGVSKDDKTLYSYDDNTGYILKADIK